MLGDLRPGLSALCNQPIDSSDLPAAVGLARRTPRQEMFELTPAAAVADARLAGGEFLPGGGGLGETCPRQGAQTLRR